MRRNPKINICNVGHFRTFRDPLHLAAEARRAKAWRSKASPAEMPLDKAIEALAAGAAGLPVVEERRPNKGEFFEVAHPDCPGVTLRATLYRDLDRSFDDLMGEGIDPIEPNGEDSAARPAPWTLRRVNSGGEIASRDTSGETRPDWRYKRNRNKGPIDLDVCEIVKGYLDCGPKGLSRHERWEAAKASGFNAAADYRRQRKAWTDGDLIAAGVEVQVCGPDGAELGRNSLWGVDYDWLSTDRSYLREVIAEVAGEALSGLPEAFARRRADLEALAAQYAALSLAEVAQ
jgi:hypothetical protein